MKLIFVVFVLLLMTGCSITGNVVYKTDKRPIITYEELKEGFTLKDNYRFHIEKGVSININNLDIEEIDYVVEIRKEGYRFWFNSNGKYSEYRKYPSYKKFSTIIGGQTRLYQIVSKRNSYVLKV